MNTNAETISLPVSTPKHELGKALQRMLEHGKRPCFRIGGLRITIASAFSTNPGSLYIKNNDWQYIGKVTPEGLLKVTSPSLITGTQKETLLEAITEPMRIAMNEGKVTGSCCCCGRTLTNKLSIELGIGPICRGFWFPDSTPIETTTVGEMIEHLESKDLGVIPEPSDADIATANLELDEITDSLDLDLGAPVTTEEVKDAVDLLKNLEVPTVEPVTDLINGYFALTPTEQHQFLGTIKKELVR